MADFDGRSCTLRLAVALDAAAVPLDGNFQAAGPASDLITGGWLSGDAK